MKRIITLMLVLLLLTLPLMASAQEVPLTALQAPNQETTPPSLIMSATVEGKVMHAFKAPASGALAPFTLQEGDVVTANTALFTVESEKVYADIDGTVRAIYVQKGDTLVAAQARYGAAMKIEYQNRFTVEANTYSGYDRDDYHLLYVGMPVFVRSNNGKRFADGVITQVQGSAFTVELKEGTILYEDDVKVYLTKKYRNDELLASDSITAIAPYDVSVASGTVVDVAVKTGDVVKAGDLLFSYVPDTLAPEKRGAEDALTLLADKEYAVVNVSATQGMKVQKDQVLAMGYALEELELVGHVEERDVANVSIGDTFTVRFDEFDIAPLQATVTDIGSVGDTSGERTKYPVRLSFPITQGIRIGMHATLER